MTDKSNRFMSVEAGEGFIACTDALRKTHKVLALEQNGDPTSLFDAVRLYMIAAVIYLARGDMKGSDEEMREALHSMLDMAINDYQFNQRQHIGSKEGS